MRQILCVALGVAVLGTLASVERLEAQPTTSGPLFTLAWGPDNVPAVNVPVEMVHEGTRKPLGETNAKGQLRLDPGAAAGDEWISVRAAACRKSKSKNPTVYLLRTGYRFQDPNQPPPSEDFVSKFLTGDCTTQELRPTRFHEDYTGFIDPEVLKLVKGGRRFPVDNSPLGYATLGGASLGGIFAVGKIRGNDGGDAIDVGGDPPAGGLASVLGAYNFNGIVRQRGGCLFNNFTSLATFSGTEQAFNAVIAESVTIPYAGVVRFSAGAYEFTTNFSGSNPILGTFSTTFLGKIFPNRTAAGTQTINLACGAVVVDQSGEKRP